MLDIDLSEHEDVRRMADADEIVGHIVASCSCMTKTPEVRHHSRHCRYKHLMVRLSEVSPAHRLA